MLFNAMPCFVLGSGMRRLAGSGGTAAQCRAGTSRPHGRATKALHGQGACAGV